MEPAFNTRRVAVQRMPTKPDQAILGLFYVDRYSNVKKWKEAEFVPVPHFHKQQEEQPTSTQKSTFRLSRPSSQDTIHARCAASVDVGSWTPALPRGAQALHRHEQQKRKALKKKRPRQALRSPCSIHEIALHVLHHAITASRRHAAHSHAVLKNDGPTATPGASKASRTWNDTSDPIERPKMSRILHFGGSL